MGVSDAEARRLIPWLKARVYRFSDDARLHVVLECLERKLEEERPLSSPAYEMAKRLIESQAAGEVPDVSLEDVASAEGIDVPRELQVRHALNGREHGEHGPTVTVAGIIGPPRSGTSALFNLLSWCSDAAFFSDCSAPFWPRAGLMAASAKGFRNAPKEVLYQPTAAAKLTTRWSWPSEAEAIFQRVAPSYAWVGGHRYQLLPPSIAAPEMLRSQLAVHAGHFNSPTVLTKSPFNSTRAPAMHKIAGCRWVWIVLLRHPADVAESIAEHEFRYAVDGRWLTPTESWEYFINQCRQAPGDVHWVSFEDLLENADGVVGGLCGRLGIRQQRKAPSLRCIPRRKSNITIPQRTIRLFDEFRRYCR